MKRRAFFTLIELIIVIAIIGVLLSLLLPSLSRAKESAKRAVCLSNQKQLHTMSMLFAKENNYWIPRGAMNDGTSNEEKNAFSIYRMRKYIGIDENVIGSISNNANGYHNFFSKYPVLQCPSFDQDFALTYLVNSMDFKKAANGTIKEMHHASTKGYDLITSPESADKTALFTELNSNVLGTKDFGSYNISKYTDLPYNEFGAPQFSGRMLNSASNEHYGKGVAVFFDGHAKIFSSKSKGLFTNPFINGN